MHTIIVVVGQAIGVLKIIHFPEYRIMILLQAIFRTHLKLLVQNLYNLILGAYGNPWKICPSPLLSCLLEGCVDSGTDMTNGGSRYMAVHVY